MSSARISRVLTRIAYQIFEDTRGSEKLVVFGVDERGYNLAAILASRLSKIYGTSISAHIINIKNNSQENPGKKGHGEEESLQSPHPNTGDLADLPSIDDKKVVIVDDVMYSGKTMYKALQTVAAKEHPEEIKLAALVDRGHRRYPLDIQYLGLHCPTKLQEHVHCRFKDNNEPDGVWLLTSEDETSW